MKTTDPRDPLDRKIDELLASKPIKASDDFLARTLAAIDEEPQAKKPKTMAPIIRFALPAAAAIAIAFVAFTQIQQSADDAPLQIASTEKAEQNTTPTIQNTSDAPAIKTALVAMTPESTQELSDSEIDELLLLQEGLSGFADLDTESLNSAGLLNTLDSLYSI